MCGFFINHIRNIKYKGQSRWDFLLQNYETNIMNHTVLHYNLLITSFVQLLGQLGRLCVEHVPGLSLVATYFPRVSGSGKLVGQSHH